MLIGKFTFCLTAIFVLLVQKTMGFEPPVNCYRPPCPGEKSQLGQPRSLPIDIPKAKPFKFYK